MGAHGVYGILSGRFLVIAFYGVGLDHLEFLICSCCHCSMLSDVQAMVFAPNRIGAGNRPSLTRLYISLRDNPTRFVSCFNRIKHNSGVMTYFLRMK